MGQKGPTLCSQQARQVLHTKREESFLHIPAYLALQPLYYTITQCLTIRMTDKNNYFQDKVKIPPTCNTWGGV